MTEISSATPDLQASSPEVRLSLTRAGVTGVQKAIRVRHEGHQTVMAAQIECTVDLSHEQKGVHMSRFPELFEEAIEAVVGTEALHVEALAEHIARHIVGRQSALRAEARITAQWPVRRTTPVSELSTQEMVSLVGIAAATADGVRRVVGVEATGINACPCAQGLVRGRAAERLAEAGYEDVERILDLVPLATHNQRGRGSLYVGTERQLDANDLVAIVQGSMSAPIYELLKRPDELFVVEHAHLQPRFVEDSVRLSVKGALEAMPDLADDDFVFARQVNFETIHAHDVLAEREGTVGEIRAELGGAPAPAATRASPTGSRLGRRGLRPAAEVEAALGACAEARDVRLVQDEHRDGRDRREDDHRPRLAERERDEGQRTPVDHRRQRGVAGDEEDDEPDREADQPDDRRDAEERPARRSRPSCRPSGSGGRAAASGRASPPRPRARRPARPTRIVPTSAGTNPFATSSTTIGIP